MSAAVSWAHDGLTSTALEEGVMVWKTVEDIKLESSRGGNALPNITQLQCCSEEYRVQVQSGTFKDSAEKLHRRTNHTMGSFKLTRKDLLTQGHEVITVVQHHVRIQLSLFRAQMSPLVRRKDHGHVSESHRVLK